MALRNGHVLDDGPRCLRVVCYGPVPAGPGLPRHPGNVSINDSVQLDIRSIVAARIVVSPDVARKLAAELIAAADAVDGAERDELAREAAQAAAAAAARDIAKAGRP